MQPPHGCEKIIVDHMCFRFKFLLLQTCLASVIFLNLVADGIAMDFVMGRVLAVDRSLQQFVLSPLDPSDLKRSQLDVELEGKKNLAYVVRLAETSELSFLPPCVKEGELIRVWGVYHPEQNIFEAVDICGIRGWNKDKSGVRKRLGKGWRGRYK